MGYRRDCIKFKGLATGRIGHQHPTSVHSLSEQFGPVVQLNTAPWSACNGFCPCCVVQQEVQLDILLFTVFTRAFPLGMNPHAFVRAALKRLPPRTCRPEMFEVAVLLLRLALICACRTRLWRVLDAVTGSCSTVRKRDVSSACISAKKEYC